jgi:hypothetical protein
MPSERSGPALVTLHIGEFQTNVAQAGLAGKDGQETTIGIGFMSPGSALSHTPPTSLELEHAIEAVEDVVMPLASTLRHAAELATSDTLAHRIATLASSGGGQGELLSIDVVESLFGDMAAVASGRPASGSPFLDSALCGYLLILREFMHHLGFACVRVRPAG